MVATSAFSPSTFFATAAALIQNKTALDTRNRSGIHQYRSNSGQEIPFTPFELNKMGLGEYQHSQQGNPQNHECIHFFFFLSHYHYVNHYIYIYETQPNFYL